MEFVEGDRINDIEALKLKFGSPEKVSSALIDIYARMVFLYGHVHCDAHPGNIFIRKQPNGKPQIVLLDHGFYCTTGEKFRRQFCELWYSLVCVDYEKTK